MADAAQWESPGGLGVVRMAALERLGGATAYFTGRAGGVSAHWSGGLNWSYSVGDDPEQVRENRRRSLGIAGLPLERAAVAGLVHGDRVVAVTGEEPRGSDGVSLIPDCDGLITDRAGLALVITAADCVPVFLYDPVRRAAGVVHAGWRGTVLGIAGKAAAALSHRYGCRPENIYAAVGPSIGPCCYEIDEPVAGPVRAHFGETAERLLLAGAAPGKYQLDLWEANRLDLLGAGVGSVSVAGECTACGVSRLFSHRAEAGRAGRGAAILAMQGGAEGLPKF